MPDRCEQKSNSNFIDGRNYFSNEQFKFKPRLIKTSAEPTFPLALLFPCFAILTPQDAATNATAVEILKVLSPPVPQVSLNTNLVLVLAIDKHLGFLSHRTQFNSCTAFSSQSAQKLQSQHQIFDHSATCIKDLEVKSSRFSPSNKLFRILAFDKLEDIYLLKIIMLIKFNLKYQNLNQLNL